MPLMTEQTELAEKNKHTNGTTHHQNGDVEASEKAEQDATIAQKTLRSDLATMSDAPLFKGEVGGVVNGFLSAEQDGSIGSSNSESAELEPFSPHEAFVEGDSSNLVEPTNLPPHQTLEIDDFEEENTDFRQKAESQESITTDNSLSQEESTTYPDSVPASPSSPPSSPPSRPKFENALLPNSSEGTLLEVPMSPKRKEVPVGGGDVVEQSYKKQREELSPRLHSQLAALMTTPEVKPEKIVTSPASIAELPNFVTPQFSQQVQQKKAEKKAEKEKEKIKQDEPISDLRCSLM